MTFFPALPYTKPHKVASHFVEVCFRFVQTGAFLLPFSLPRFIIIIDRSINRSQTFVNAFIGYILFWYINVYITHKNVELVPVLSSVFC